ncbi:MAG: DUF3302 domain-containing protein [Planctomycetota bacterium]|nr:DUF3302 domain-containing protein [Planctomycetota bacterium]
MMIFAFLVLVLLAVLLVYALVALAKWPKSVALQRGHPYPDAVNVLSWGGLILTAGLAWLGALTWAHATPAPSPTAPDASNKETA